MDRTYISAENDVQVPEAAVTVLREHGCGAGYRIGTAVFNGTNKREAHTRAVSVGVHEMTYSKVRVLDEAHEYAGALLGHLDHYDSLLIVTSGRDVVEYMDRRWSWAGRLDAHGRLTEDPTGSQARQAAQTLLPLAQGRTEHELSDEQKRALKVLIRASEAYGRTR